MTSELIFLSRLSRLQQREQTEHSHTRSNKADSKSHVLTVLFHVCNMKRTRQQAIASFFIYMVVEPPLSSNLTFPQAFVAMHSSKSLEGSI